MSAQISFISVYRLKRLQNYAIKGRRENILTFVKKKKTFFTKIFAPLFATFSWRQPLLFGVKSVSLQAMKCRHSFLIVVLFSLLPLCVEGADSTFVKSGEQAFKVEAQKGVNSLFNSSSYAGLGLVGTGLCVKSYKRDFREMRNRSFPSFKTTVDDYIQYAPLLATWGLNLSGVQGKSSFKRLALSNVSSALIMAALVNGIKYTVREMRPDDTSPNSFPSGHTATAFMAATILHKEYGATKSYWYSVAGYSLAAATGVCRVLNNRHWVSDVLVGAGIGIVSVELGYFLSDLILKDKNSKKNSKKAKIGY